MAPAAGPARIMPLPHVPLCARAHSLNIVSQASASIDRAAWLALIVACSAALEAAPTITTQPEPALVVSGTNATFTVAASGTGALSYQWRRDGHPIPSANEATLVVTGARRGAAGLIDVLVTDDTGSATSDAVQLSVAPTQYPALVTADPTSDLQLETELETFITDVLALPDGGYLIAGPFVKVNNVQRHRVARFTAGGGLDTHFVPAEISTCSHLSLGRQSDGKILVAGDFDSVDRHRQPALARLHADGRYDPTFDAQLHDPLSLNYSASDLLVEPDDSIVIIVEQGDRPVRRLSPDGEWMTDFAALFNGQPTRVARQSDGRIIVAGSFSATSGDITRHNVVRFLTDGTLDLSFDIGSAADGSVEHLLVLQDDSIVVAGNFQQISAAARPGLAHYSANGALLEATLPAQTQQVRALARLSSGDVAVSWVSKDKWYETVLYRLTPDGVTEEFSTSAPNVSVYAAEGLPNGRLVVAGSFSHVGNLEHPYVATYAAQGTLQSQGIFGLSNRGRVYAVAATADGKTLVGGEFSRAKGRVARDLIRLNSDGSIDTAFSFAGGDAGHQPIYAILPLPDGRIAIAGAFESIGSASRSRIAVLQPNGALDPAFASTTSINRVIRRLARHPDGRILTVVSNSLSGETGYPIFAYKPDGSPDVFTIGAGFDAQIMDIVAHPDGKVIVAGDITEYQGTAVGRIARLNPDGTLDEAFNQGGAGFNSTVSRIVIAPEGRIWVAGHFTSFNGRSAPGVTRLLPDGTPDPEFVPKDIPAVSRFEDILLQEDGKVIITASEPWVAAGEAPFYRLNSDGSLDSTFRSSSFQVEPLSMNLVMRDDGQLIAPALDGRIMTTAGAAPVVEAAPAPQITTLGQTGALSVTVSSAAPVTYQWFLNGRILPDERGRSLTLTALQPDQIGRYHVEISSAFGTVETEPVLVAPPQSERGRIVNLSIRTTVGAGQNTLIVGYVIGGAGTSDPKPLLIRGVGPTLAHSFDLSSAVSDSRLELYNEDQVKIDENDDWNGVFDFGSVGAFPLADPIRDAALYNPLTPSGSYTAHLLSKESSGGVALAEIYDATPANLFTDATPRLVNASARTSVGKGESTLITGFAIGGSSPARVLVRASGPALTAEPFNLEGMVSDPAIEVFDSANAIVGANDNWSDADADTVTLADAFAAAGAFDFPTDSKDSAAVLTLSPGTYTVHIRTKDGSTGLVLVEVYELP